MVDVPLIEGAAFDVRISPDKTHCILEVEYLGQPLTRFVLNIPRGRDLVGKLDSALGTLAKVHPGTQRKPRGQRRQS